MAIRAVPFSGNDRNNVASLEPGQTAHAEFTSISVTGQAASAGAASGIGTGSARATTAGGKLALRSDAALNPRPTHAFSSTAADVIERVPTGLLQLAEMFPVTSKSKCRELLQALFGMYHVSI